MKCTTTTMATELESCGSCSPSDWKPIVALHRMVRNDGAEGGSRRKKWKYLFVCLSYLSSICFLTFFSALFHSSLHCVVALNGMSSKTYVRDSSQVLHKKAVALFLMLSQAFSHSSVV